MGRNGVFREHSTDESRAEKTNYLTKYFKIGWTIEIYWVYSISTNERFEKSDVLSLLFLSHVLPCLSPVTHFNLLKYSYICGDDQQMSQEVRKQQRSGLGASLYFPE